MMDFESRVRNGSMYMVSTSKVTLALAGNVSITFKNNSTTKSIFIYALASSSDISAMSYATLLLDPTTNLPTTTLVSFNQNIGSSNTTSAVVKADAGTAMTGGTTLFTIPIPSGRTVFDKELILLPPSRMLGLNVAFSIAASMVLRVFFWEE